jgi:sugar phosphate isomerase/epimerase
MGLGLGPESGDHEFDCIIGTNVLGSLYVTKGDLDRAIPQLERSLALARMWSRVGWSTVGFLAKPMRSPDATKRLSDSPRKLSEPASRRSVEALALRLLAEVASHRDRFQLAEAEEYSREALALATELGMRPLVAHCYSGSARSSGAWAKGTRLRSASPPPAVCTERWT